MDRDKLDCVTLLVGWPVYFIFYFITERIPPEDCHIIHCVLDDMIPFNEYFAVFYFGWYALVIGSLCYFFFRDTDSFKKLQIFIMITQAIAMVIYIAYPSVQTGRPEVMNDNIFCDVMRFIYATDTPTGVFPSLHVAYSVGIASVWMKRKRTVKLWKWFVVVFSIMVCISVAFVKQHSVLDIASGFAVSMAAEYIVYKEWYRAFSRLLRYKVRELKLFTE